MSDLTLLANDLETAARALARAVDEASTARAAGDFLHARGADAGDLAAMTSAFQAECRKAIEAGRALQVAGVAFCAELDRMGGDSRGVRRVLANLAGNGERANPRTLLPDLLAEIGRALAVVGTQPADPGELPADNCTHSPDFRSVLWHGVDYQFTKGQAACVAILWLAWETGTPDVGDETLLEEVDAESSRLVDLFRGNPAWGTMIIPGATKGSRRLSDPNNS